jgi:hypothetical protein
MPPDKPGGIFNLFKQSAVVFDIPTTPCLGQLLQLCSDPSGTLFIIDHGPGV